ncbi:hypothetical protein I350_01049 [Cryptococcus amylolentus CBS 6273]|uniref:Uncharacterized protein n=1 Tax=Cryptococcus amylolentus CBS 6273 TaxID=1296118 RepID=A0A1E3KBG1_9TREE|nr:hypothetical protein I350_01049 [Cryptococcus amylolentus CBS 6273]
MSGDQPYYDHTGSSGGGFSQYTDEPDTYGGYGAESNASTGGYPGQSCSEGYGESPFGEDEDDEDDEDDFLDPEEEERMMKEQSDRGLREYTKRLIEIQEEYERLTQSSSGGSRGSGGSDQRSSSSSKKKRAEKPKRKPAKKPSSSKSEQASELTDIDEEEE